MIIILNKVLRFSNRFKFYETYVVSLPNSDVCELGWSFYNGSCFYTSDTCETWSKASTICRRMGANLPAIESQEENVYIQHRHNGEKAWIGLNDIAIEGLFTWVDGCPDKFRYWAESQPNDFRGEDCVHTLGPGHGYMWNDVDCTACHQYTCKKGVKWLFIYLFIFDDSYFDLVAGQRCPSLELEMFWSLIYLKYLLKGDLPPISQYVVNELASLRLSLCFHSYIHSYFVHHSFNIGDVWCCVLTISILKYLSTDYDECTSNPCLNGGTCVNGKRKFRCICPATHKGDLCEGEHHICNFFLIIMKSQRQKFIIA